MTTNEGNPIWIGMIFRSETGNRFRVTGTSCPYTFRGDGRVRVQRLDAPEWDDGVYIFHVSQLSAMTLEDKP